MQTAGRGVDLALGIEFAARVQRAHDHFERGFLRRFRVRINRDTAPIVGDGHEPVGPEFDLDEGRIAGERLIHGVVDHFSKQMVQRLLIGAADIHARPAAHRLQPFEHLDVARRVSAFPRGNARRLGGRAPGFRQA